MLAKLSHPGNVPADQLQPWPYGRGLFAALVLRTILILSETYETQCAKPSGLSTSWPPTVGGSGTYRYRQRYQYVPGIEAMNGQNNT